MSNPLALNGHDQIDAQVVTPSDSDSTGDLTGEVINGVGESTGEYNDTDGDANGTTFIRTDLGRVDVAQVEIAVTDESLETGSAAIIVGEARAAVPGDFDTADDFVEGSIFIALYDAADGTEVADDTNITTLDFSYVAVRK